MEVTKEHDKSGNKNTKTGISSFSSKKEDVTAQVKQFLVKATRIEAISDDEELFRPGFLNSLLATQLVMFVEKQFGIEVVGPELSMDNFGTVERIADFVANKLETRESWDPS